MRYFANATPRQMLSWSFRFFAVAMPLCLVQMVAWAVGVHPLPATLALMVYLLLLATAGCSVVVAALAACHLSVGRAFGAGLRAGQDQSPPEPGSREDTQLRAVE